VQARVSGQRTCTVRENWHGNTRVFNSGGALLNEARASSGACETGLILQSSSDKLI
jgi:hypothetical protein